MPLDETQRTALNEIVRCTRVMYRDSLRLQKTGDLSDAELAILYVNGQVVATYTSMLWRQSGERARAEHARLATETGEPTSELPEG